MRRRLKIALLVAVAILGGSTVLIVGGAIVLLRTDWGNEKIRGMIAERAQAALGDRGRALLGGLTLSPLGTVSLDTLEIRDDTGALVLASGPIRGRYALAPLLDREVSLTQLTVLRPQAHFAQNEAGSWNIGALFSDTAAAPEPNRPASTASAWRITLDSFALADGLLTISRPDSLPALPPVRSAYRDLQLVLGPSQYALADKHGEFAVRRLSVDIESPPVPLLHAEGRVGMWPDSLQLALAAVRLRGTNGSLEGGIGWGVPDQDARLDLTLRADTLAFTDIAWISELVPDSGGGSAVVRITNGPERGVIRYAIDSLEATGTGSRFGGRFTADVGDAVAIRDVDVTLAPLDLVILAEMFGDSMPPAPWDGLLRGRVVAPGGPLTAWALDTTSLEFEDRRIGGAISRFTLAGLIDLQGDPLALRPLFVGIDSLDIRTLGALTERADSLGGYLRGALTVAGPMDDFRFDGLDLVHDDGDDPPSHLRGAGRLALDTAQTWLEAQLIFDTLNVAAFGRAFTPQQLRGVMAGFVSAEARGDSVALEVSLTGEGTYLTFSGATSLDTARVVLAGRAAMEQFDARQFLVGSELPAHRLTALAELDLQGTWEGVSGPVLVVLDSTSDLAGLKMREGRADLVFEPGGIRVDTLAVESAVGRMSARGRLSRDPALRDSLRFDAAIDSMALLRGFLPDSLAVAWEDSLAGSLAVRGVLLGSLDTMDVRATFHGQSLQAGANAVDTITGTVALDGLPAATRGNVSFDAANVLALGFPVTRLAAQAAVREARWVDASMQAEVGDTLRATARAELEWMRDSLRVRIDSVNAESETATWALLEPTELFNGPDRLTIDTVRLASTDGASLLFAARSDSAGPVAALLQATRVPFAHAQFTGLVPAGLVGRISAAADVRGTRSAPEITVNATVDSATADGRRVPDLRFAGTYADRKAELELYGKTNGRESFVLTGTLPLDLAFESRTREQRLVDDEELYLRFVADATSLEGIGPFVPGVADLSGAFDADMLVTGTWGDYEPRGVFLLRDGRFTVPALQTGFADMIMDVSFSPDSVILHRVRLADGAGTTDTATVTGAIVRTPSGWYADIDTYARQLRVIDDPRLAEADVSWQFDLRGPLDSLVLSGEMTVPSGNAFISTQSRQVLALPEDEAAAAQRRKYIPRLENVTVQLGNEVRLRSPEANVQLQGSVDVTGTLQAPDVVGEISATRGTYRLDLGLLQRTFQVDSGVVRVDGVIPLGGGFAVDPPTLDIFASYLVRQAQAEDVQIHARITGTTRRPRLSLYSADLGTTATDTEIISYLLFGAPSFALDNRGSSAVRSATAALVPSIGGAVEQALGGRIPFISELQVTTVAGNSPSDFTLNSFEGLLNSFALTAGAQLSPDSFLRVSTGVCRGENRAAQSLPAWFGIAYEYRPREKLSAQVSIDPGSSPCTRVGSFQQIYQFGLDLFRDWRW
ncbi:MAG TPA: translocation/assembly module TamB domain-containing protein [Gemmatimonadaceae bacterium]|nr:translocation/assembly module TamB domain-containing protein [Gemmatimonadaceae bacterium]